MSAKEQFKAQFQVKPHKLSKIKKIIAVVSGKGGVGKSMITSLIAVELNRLEKNVGIIDADITGASIPHYFGLTSQLYASEDAIIPQSSKNGIKVVSSNLMLEDPTKPIIWRAPMITSLIKQFYTEVFWDEIDYLLIDLPPGTGDVTLTVFQSFPIDSVVMVTTPQELVSEVVEKTINMANEMEIPTSAIIQNMSYVICPDCGKKIELFGDYSSLLVKYSNIPFIKLPLRADLAKLADNGEIENVKDSFIQDIVKYI